MNSRTQCDITTHIIEKAKGLGATLAGITTVASVQNSPSHKVWGKGERPEKGNSFVVMALAHEPSRPELDWWDDKQGGSPGNRQLISVAKSLRQWLEQECNISAWPLPYHVENGGIFLKDAAALAGLGIVGKNNLLLTPEFGPRVRLRALLLHEDLEPSGSTDFAPCETCDMPCTQACPQRAFRNGFYSRTFCDRQMRRNEANKATLEKSDSGDLPSICIKYCRACELACPEGGI